MNFHRANEIPIAPFGRPIRLTAENAKKGRKWHLRNSLALGAALERERRYNRTLRDQLRRARLTLAVYQTPSIPTGWKLVRTRKSRKKHAQA
jgi:hypothetical protein